MKNKSLRTVMTLTLASTLLLALLLAWGPRTVLAEDQPDGSIIVSPQTSDGTWGPGIITATADVSIDAGVVITVAPGTTIRMADGVGLTVNGDLRSAGPVTFTTASTPATPGAWAGITYAPGSSGSLERTTVEYAQHALTLNTSNPITVSHSTLRLNRHQTSSNNQDAYGAGLLILDGDHSIAYTDIYSNVVRATGSGAEVYGGAVDIRSGASEFAHSRIWGNAATSTRSNGGGGGIVIRAGSAPLIRNSEISSNTLTTNLKKKLASGGGIVIYGTTQAVIRDSWIAANESENENSQGYGGGGGIGLTGNARVQLIDGNVIASNRAWGPGHSEGGGIDSWENNAFTVSNNLFYNNSTGSIGGAMNINGNVSAGDINIFNNTIIGNSANQGGGLYRQSGGRVFNNVIVGNNATANNGGGGVYGSSGSAGYNDVWGNTANNTTNNYNGSAPGTDVQIDPLFTGTGDLVARYQLRQGSPVIDLGTNSGVGLPDDDYSDTPRPLGATWDIGFDEVIPFTVTKSVDLNTASGGMPLVYTLVVTNPDPGSALVGGQLTDTIPLNAVYSDGPTCNLGTCAYNIGGDVITWTGDIPGSAGLTLSFTVQVDLALTDGTEIVNQADIIAGADMVTTDPVTTTIYNPVLAVTKRAAPEPVEAGERLDYTIVIENNGLGDATGVSISDPLPDQTQFIAGSIALDPPAAGAPGSAPPDLASDIRINAGQRVTLTYAVTIDQPLDAGTLIANTASVTSVQDPTPISDDVQSTVSTTPAVSVTKDGPDTASVGETVVYTFSVTNLGNTLLHDVQVMDDHTGAIAYVAGDDGDGWLDLSEAWVYTASITVQSTDSDPLINTVTVTATDVLDTEATAQAWHTLDIQFAPALTVVKDGPTTTAVGETIVYTFTVSNDDVNGDGSPVQITSVNDDVVGAATYQSGDDGDDQLEVGEAWIYSASYTVLGTDPDPLENTVTVSGTDRDGDAVSADDAHSTALTFAPALTVLKDGPSAAQVGETIVYTFSVSNDDVNGDGSPVQITGINDDVAGDATYQSGDDGDGWLQVGETWVYTASYTVLGTDPDPLENTVTVSGTDRDGAAVSANDTHSTTITFAPALTVVKGGPSAAQVGETVVYTFSVSNDDVNGDGSPVQITGVNDDLAGDATYQSGDDGDDQLEVGEAWIYSASYTVLGTDPDPLENTVTVSGTDRDGGALSATDTHSTALGYAPALTVLKEGPSAAQVGETVVYTFSVSHDDVSGDGSPVQITGVNDDVAGDATYQSGDDGDRWLQVGETWVYTASYTILSTDPDPLENTVTVTGQDRDGAALSATDTHSTAIGYAPALIVVKEGPDVAQVGETVGYTFTVTHDEENSDGSPVSDLAVNDDVAGAATYLSGDDGDGWLQVGESWVYTVSYTIAPTDTSPLINTVTVEGLDRDGRPVSASDEHSTIIVQFGPGIHMIFLPLAVNNAKPPAPDLVVEQITITSQGVQVVIKNQGDAPVNDAFWVDLYVDPDPVPTGVNQVWDDGRSAQGMTWGITGYPPILSPGQRLTLNVNNAYYSNVTWPLPAGTPVYVQVDSAKLDSPYGAVLESHEMNGGAYNNISHVLVSATTNQTSAASTPDTALWATEGSPADLPIRP